MSLTLTAKEYWRHRMGSIIDAEIEELKESVPHLYDGPALTRYKNMALRLMGIDNVVDEIRRLRAEVEEMNKRIDDLWDVAAQTVSGMTLEQAKESWGSRYWQTKSFVDDMVKERAKEVQNKAVAKSDIGQRLAELEAKRQQIDDTIMIATSPKELKSLFVKFAEMMGYEMGDLVEMGLNV